MLRIPAFFRPPFAGSQTSFPEVQIPHPDKTTLLESRVVFIWSGREDCPRHCCAMLVPQALICFAYRRSFARLSLVVEPPSRRFKSLIPTKTTLLESKVVFIWSGREVQIQYASKPYFIAFYTSIQSKFFSNVVHFVKHLNRVNHCIKICGCQW